MRDTRPRLYTEPFFRRRWGALPCACHISQIKKNKPKKKVVEKKYGKRKKKFQEWHRSTTKAVKFTKGNNFFSVVSEVTFGVEPLSVSSPCVAMLVKGAMHSIILLEVCHGLQLK
jgi:hypothetical protein